MDKITYNFEGYYRVSDNYLPKKSGIYVLYEGIPGDGRVILGDIVYIGQTENFSDRLPDHIDEWKLAGNSELYAAIAEFNLDQLDQAEAALVFDIQPKFNDRLKDSYSHESAKLYLYGKKHGMNPTYEVKKGKKIDLKRPS